MNILFSIAKLFAIIIIAVVLFGLSISLVGGLFRIIFRLAGIVIFGAGIYYLYHRFRGTSNI